MPAINCLRISGLSHCDNTQHVMGHLKNIIVLACLIDEITREVLYEDLFCFGKSLADLFCDVVGGHNLTGLAFSVPPRFREAF